MEEMPLDLIFKSAIPIDDIDQLCMAIRKSRFVTENTD